MPIAEQNHDTTLQKWRDRSIQECGMPIGPRSEPRLEARDARVVTDCATPFHQTSTSSSAKPSVAKIRLSWQACEADGLTHQEMHQALIADALEQEHLVAGEDVFVFGKRE